MYNIYAAFRYNLWIVFFIYGLAFFTMSIAVFVQPIGKTRFKLAGVLWLLGWFGLLHGTYEWLDGLAILRGRYILLDVLRLSTLFVSYAFLFEFGRRLFRIDAQYYSPGLKRIASQLSWRVTSLSAFLIIALTVASNDIWDTGAMLVRYSFGLFGGILVCSGFFLYYAYEKRELEPLRVKKYFFSAGVTFLIYGLLAGLVAHKGRYFPASRFNEDLFLSLTGAPVQLFRAVCAIIIGWSTIGILKIFNLETIKNLEEEIALRKKSESEREKLNDEILKSNEKLTQLALEDSNTGLYNYRYLVGIIEPEFNRAKRNIQPLSALMLDIDYFKSINDVYGHQFGDLILKQFAHRLKMVVRHYDIVIRYGGEEFVILSPAVSRQSAIALGRRILDTVNAGQFGNDEYVVKLKVSIAVVSYPSDIVFEGMDMIELADRILGKVKEKGGNLVYSSSDIEEDSTFSWNKDEETLDMRVLKEKINKLTMRANQSVIEAVVAFAKVMELKDHYSRDDIEHSVTYSVETAAALGLPKDDIENIRQGAIIRNLGKIGISEEILNKPSRLNDMEFEKIKTHPHMGIDIIRPIQSMANIAPLVFYHHERWDGKGYPVGLKGESIPLGARIIAVADSYQALISDRPYRKAYDKKEALKIIKDSSGSRFDPKIVDAFLKVLQK